VWPRRDPLADPEALIRRVYAYVAYQVGDGPIAEDVTSEVMERAVRYRESYDPRKAQPATWILGIARRTIADHRGVQETLPLPDDTGTDPGDLESSVVERLTVERAIMRLGERDRQLVTLRYAADLSARQIAVVLEMETHAVDVALGRALVKLREELEAAPTRSAHPL
jgi:RNA polymerase sigma factor (sigma-70 family)